MVSKFLRSFLFTLTIISLFFPGNPGIANAMPPALTLEFAAKMGGKMMAIAVAGNKTYVGEGYRLAVLDTSTPAAPALLGKSPALPEIIQGITVSGSRAYVADGAAGLYILDVSAPASPAIVGWLDTPGQAAKVAVAGSYAYVADLFSGLRVMDISKPANPVMRGTYYPSNAANGVAVKDNFSYNGIMVFDILVAGGASGLYVLRIAGLKETYLPVVLR